MQSSDGSCGRSLPSAVRLSHSPLSSPHPLNKMPPGNTPSQDESNSPEQASGSAFSLENILSGDHENIEHPTAPKEALTSAGGWDEEAAHEKVAQGFCVECEGVYDQHGRLCACSGS